MKTLFAVVLAASFGAVAMHFADAAIVRDVLNSDDWSITRNVEQANALLDIYEAGKTYRDIQRDASGRETDVPTLRLVGSLRSLDR